MADNPGADDQDDQDNQTTEAFSRWVKEQFRNMARHAADNGLFKSERVEGRPVWAIPNKAFIGKIFATDDVDNAYWVISGVFHTDHVPVKVAPTAREAARHFSLKWQMQSARVEGGDGAQADVDQNWTGIGENLARQAETLYALVENDKVWENVREMPDP